MLAVSKVKEKKKEIKIACNPLLPQPPFLLSVVAPRRSGKSNLLVDLLIDDNKLCKKFDVIFIWSRTYHHDSKWKNIQLPPGSVFTSFVEREALVLLELTEAVTRKNAFSSLWIFDDMIADKIMNTHRMGALEAIAVRGRHSNISLVIISQQVMSLSPAIRNNSTNLVIFRIRNSDELEKIARENRESLDAAQFMDIYDYATRDPFSFLHINNQEQDPKLRFRKGWDELLILSPQ